MLEECVEKKTLKMFRNKTENIDRVVEWTYEKENTRISDKYSHISNHVKILKNLMAEFARKADIFEKHLLAVARVEETEFQSQYYQKTIEECLSSSENLKSEIELKSKKLEVTRRKVNELKKKLLKLKTDNIRVSVKMEEIEEEAALRSYKQNCESAKARRLQQTQSLRSLMVKSHQVRSTESEDQMRLRELRAESSRVEWALLSKISKANDLKAFIEQCFGVLRDKLRKQEKKSNAYGLAGSMLFKLDAQQLQRSKLCPKAKTSDSKLIIYDVLRQKYRKHEKSEAQKSEQLNISLNDFLKLSPLQIMGVIELRGGVKTIIAKKIEPSDFVKETPNDRSQVQN